MQVFALSVLLLQYPARHVFFARNTPLHRYSRADQVG
jgi:hypothetical protein